MKRVNRFFANGKIKACGFRSICLFLVCMCGISCNNSGNGGGTDNPPSQTCAEFIKTVTVTAQEQSADVEWGSCEGNTYRMSIGYVDNHKKDRTITIPVSQPGTHKISDILLGGATVVRIGVALDNTDSSQSVFNVTPAIGATLKVGTFNIRTANSDMASWTQGRKNLVCKIISDNGFDVCGINEAVAVQLSDLATLLPDYGCYSMNRGDGEHVAVLYRKSRIELVESGGFWLSETPDKESLGWGASYKRVCIRTKFKAKDTGREFCCYTTHLEHKKASEQIRVNSVNLIFQRMAADLKNEVPTFLMGDMNSEPSWLCITTLKSKLHYAKTCAFRSSGPEYTFHDFGTASICYDYIFINGPIGVTEYKVITDRPNGEYASDHYPVVTTVSLMQK